MLKIRFLVLAAAVVMGAFSAASSSRTQAVTAQTFPEKNCRYESILVRGGDTLWSIASDYCGSTDYSDILAYISNVKRINHICEDQSLRAGAYIMVYHPAG